MDKMPTGFFKYGDGRIELRPSGGGSIWLENVLCALRVRSPHALDYFLIDKFKLQGLPISLGELNYFADEFTLKVISVEVGARR